MTKAIFITGGASGIGRAVARLFAARGWRVGLGDVDAAGMAETLAGLPAGAGSAHPLDVRDRTQWDATLATFADLAGRIDVVFNNAGIAYGGPLLDHSDEEIDRLIAVNFRGVLHGARAAHAHLKRTAPGSCLLNTASAAALYGTGGLSVYSATKFAVRAVTEALDCEWEADGIMVRSLMPSFIDTPLLAGPANATTNRAKRDAVVAAGLEFTPVEVVAEAAWAAVHGKQLHTLVGKTARKLAFVAKWAPGLARQRGKRIVGS
ncbi:SDR family oxidoreductase [Novosphingobium sp. JCM 18896]|uniref:SDR family oxidoreductase n=1 Tax=Novosphingobium sp. JCM 18896 TaxID=2989731 RepID=UPI002222149C|nr:SDR family oxidoreductase [Novosphingobium sp. JCM 18896]MCW1430510.1 SDR family oxidoreductase [Novosphingobium sp. JCM 18896]